MAKLCTALVLSTVCAIAQVPGSIPPMGGGGIPIPRRGSPKTPAKVPQTLAGVLQKIEASQLTLTLQDRRTITVKRTDKTTFVGREASALKPGDEVQVSAAQGDDGWFTATSVQFVKAGVAPPPSEPDSAEPERERSVTPMPKLAPLTGDDGPPKVKRGKPAPRKAAADTVVDDSPPSTRPIIASAPAQNDAIIEKARNKVVGYLESLPNYFCQQQVARYESTSRPVNWRAVDTLSASLVYEDQKERYTDLKINGKPVKQGMEELSGAWSTGEFGTLLLDLFSPSTAADFWQQRVSTIVGRAADVYSFEVDGARSHWKVMVAGQVYHPAYKGSVWIDKETSQVLRVEMQARELPKDFPLSVVESAVDFDFVRLSELRFLLPVHAEMLSCERGSSYCTRNVIDWRNYRRFTGQSNITY